MIKKIIEEFEKFGHKHKEIIIFDLESWENFKEELNKFASQQNSEGEGK